MFIARAARPSDCVTAVRMRRSSILWFAGPPILALVGMADAAIGGVWDLFVLFTILAVVHIAALAVSGGNRVQVTLRPDLARWATQRSQRTGEPVDDVIDRAMAWYQQGLYQPPSTDGS